MKIKNLFSALTLVLILTSFSLVHAAKNPGGEVAILALGDSLTAGTQDATTLAATQMNSWISLVARQVATKRAVYFVNPWLNVEGERTNGNENPTNFGIPGLEVEEALEATDIIPLIEGVPVSIAPYLEPLNANGDTTPVDAFTYMLQKTKEEGMERWAFIWLGSNNAVYNFTRGDITLNNANKYMTDPIQFAQNYREVLEAVAGESPEAIYVITIPDILSVGFLFTTEDLSFFLGEQIPMNLIGPQALIPLTVATQMIMGAQAGMSISTLAGNLTSAEILDSGEQEIIRNYIKNYNDSIKQIAQEVGAIIIDTDEMLNSWLKKGVDAGNGRKVNRRWGQGGIFSLDGIHPSNTGHALIANSVILRINAMLSLNIPEVDVAAVYNFDPYRDLDGDGLVAGPTWKPKEGSVAAILRIFVDNDDTKFKPPPW